MSSRPRTDTDPHPGDTVNQPVNTTQTHEIADLYRRDAHAVAAVAEIAEARAREARYFRAQANQTALLEANRLLRTALSSAETDRTTGIDRILFLEDGTPDMGQVIAYLDLTAGGMTGHQALQKLLDDRDGAAFGDVLAVSKRLHHLADSHLHRAQSQPALPPATPRPAPAPLPHRQAPPESPAEQTGEIIAALRERGHVIPPEMEAAARKDGKSGLAAAAPDPAFSAVAIPSQRKLEDTVTMRADEVLADLDADDASEIDGAASSPTEPRPFSEADTAKRSGAGSGRDAGDDH